MWRKLKNLMWDTPEKGSRYFHKRHPNLPLLLSLIALAASIAMPILARRI